MTKYADTRLGNGVHTKNGQTRVTDSGGAKDTDSAQLCKTQTKHHPIDKGYAWVVLAGKYIRITDIISYNWSFDFCKIYLSFEVIFTKCRWMIFAMCRFKHT